MASFHHQYKQTKAFSTVILKVVEKSVEKAEVIVIRILMWSEGEWTCSSCDAASLVNMSRFYANCTNQKMKSIGF